MRLKVCTNVCEKRDGSGCVLGGAHLRRVCYRRWKLIRVLILSFQGLQQGFCDSHISLRIDIELCSFDRPDHISRHISGNGISEPVI